MLVDFSHNFTEKTGVDTEYKPTWSIYSDADRNIVLSDNYQSRIEKAFSKSRYKFSLHILDCNTENKSFNFSKQIKIASNSIKGQSIKKYKDIITVLYSHNISGMRIPLTPWILAHRIFHSVQITGDRSTKFISTSYDHIGNNEVKKLLTFIFNLIVDGHWPYFSYRPAIYPIAILEDLLVALLTMRSARDRVNLNKLDLLPEMMAQYIITGHIRLNRYVQINFKNLKNNHPEFNFSDKHITSINYHVTELENLLNSDCKEALDSLVGKKLIL